MNRIFIAIIFLTIFNMPLKAQRPWVRLSDIRNPIGEVFVKGNDLIGYSGTKVLLSENKNNYWKVIKDFGTLYIDGLVCSDSVIYVMLFDYIDFSNKMASKPILGGEWKIYSCNGIWLKGESGQGVTEFIIKDNIFFVGNNNGNVLKSLDYGHNWTNSSNGLITGYPGLYCNQTESIYELYTDGSNIFAGTNCYGIYYSADNGENWQPLNEGLPMATRTRVYDISSNEKRIYAVTDKGVYYSTNLGQNWLLDNRLPYDGENIEVNNDQICLPNENNIYTSKDNGISWDIINQYLAIPPFSYNNFITSDSDNFYIADENYGLSKLSYEDPTPKIFSYGLTQRHAKYLYKEDSILISASENGGLYYSTNFGKDWKIIKNSLVNIKVNSLVKFDALIVAATDSGIYSSSDKGIQWTKDLSFSEININTIVSDNNGLVVGTDNGVYIGRINSWNEINSGLQNKQINYLYSYENWIYACTAEGVYVLNDQKNEWNKMKGIPDENINSITQYHTNLFVASNKVIYYSKNLGDLWSSTSISNVNSINFLTNLDNNIFALTDKGIFLFTSNNEWFNIYLYYNSFHLLVSDSLLIASTENGIYETEFNKSLTSVAEAIPINNTLNIYPNPFSSKLNLALNEFECKQKQINIYNLNGVLVYSELSSSNESTVQLNLSLLKNGIYLLQVCDGERKISQRIIKSIR